MHRFKLALHSKKKQKQKTLTMFVASISQKDTSCDEAQPMQGKTRDPTPTSTVHLWSPTAISGGSLRSKLEDRQRIHKRARQWKKICLETWF